MTNTVLGNKYMFDSNIDYFMLSIKIIIIIYYQHLYSDKYFWTNLHYICIHHIVHCIQY